jgi:hypothetical protein
MLEKLEMRVMNIPVSAWGGNSLIIQELMKKFQLLKVLINRNMQKTTQGFIGNTIST